MADFILSCERITWSLAIGYMSGKLYLSIRSSQPKARCVYVIKRMVPKSMGTVGGHNEFAGGFVYLDSESDPDRIAEMLIKRFVRIVLRVPKSADDPEGTLLVE